MTFDRGGMLETRLELGLTRINQAVTWLGGTPVKVLVEEPYSVRSKLPGVGNNGSRIAVFSGYSREDIPVAGLQRAAGAPL